MAQHAFDAVAIQLHESDGVVVLKQSVQAGDTIAKGTRELRVVQNVGPGHKLALKEIADGAPVRKYGQIIGFALAARRS